MKVTLINVQICEANNLVPPLGILALGAALEQGGHQVQLIDDDIFIRDFTRDIADFTPDLVGLSFLTPAFSRAKHLIPRLRQLLPRTRFCSGGFHSSVFPDHTLRALGIDFCVIGEGEETLLEVCRHLQEARDITSINGICFLNSDGTATTTSPRNLIAELDSLPLPAYHLLQFEKYLRPPGLFRGMAMDRITALATSRGCPFYCTYCGGRKMFAGRVRFRSIESIRAELDHLVTQHRIRGVWIIDECFTLDAPRSREIADALRESGLAWGMQTRVDLLTEEMVHYFKQCGCLEINFGVESGVDRVLGFLKKGTTTAAALTAFSWCRSAGVRTTANFMIGTPTETEHDVMETFRFSKKLKASYTVFHITMPLPGTELYEYALAHNLMKQPEEFDDRWMHRASKGPLITTQIPPGQLMSMRARFQNHFFLRNNLTWGNICYCIKILRGALRTPVILTHSLHAFWRHKRLDSFFETLVAYSYRTSSRP